MNVSRASSDKNIAGFTLLEALVATALMATILTALAMITAQWLPNWNRGFTRLQQNENLALGLERVIADLAAAEFISTDRDTIRPLFEGSAVSVTFVRTALAPNALPGLEIVRMAEIGNGEARVLVRMRAPFVPAPEGAGGRAETNFADPVVLMRVPYRLTFSYAGTDRIWRDTWLREGRLPRAIKLTLREAATHRTLAVSTATLVHAELPAECIVAKALADCFAARFRRSQSADGKTGDITDGRSP